MTLPVRRVHLPIVFASMLLVVAATGCGLVEESDPRPRATPAADDANLFENGGFENGEAPWRWLDTHEQWRRFAISDEEAHSGAYSVKLDVAGSEGEEGSRITGTIQTVETDAFPEFLSGYYRVQEWRPEASFQYLQFVVVVRGGDFGDDLDLHEVRFPIAGIDHEPFRPANAWFVFLRRGQPSLREWTYFGYPIRRAFEVRWGRAPTTWDGLEFFFEARYDGKTAEQAATSASVYFDDLYLGPQMSNPNRPD